MNGTGNNQRERSRRNSLRRRVNRLAADAISQASAALARRLREYYRGLDRASAARKGAAHTGFWARVAGTARILRESPFSATVAMTHPLLPHKVSGGWIHARRARFLTIPLKADAHGLTARQYTRKQGVRLFFVRRKGTGEGLLARALTGGGIEPVYLLKPSVWQPPDPDALPNPQSLARDLIPHRR